MKNFRSRGFTLIELLVVIGILAILLAITLIAINPQRQFQQSNNTKRSSDVNAILNAINQVAADNRGALPAGIDSSIRTISNDTNINATARVDICASMVPTYIAALQVDPGIAGSPVTDCTATYNTGYTVVSSGANRITVAAPGAQLAATIQVTR
jgi:type IV pilus assembly protein PilA